MRQRPKRIYRATAAAHGPIEDAPTVILFLIAGIVGFTIMGAVLWDIARAISPILLAELAVGTVILAVVTLRAMAQRTDPQVGPTLRFAVAPRATNDTRQHRA